MIIQLKLAVASYCMCISSSNLKLFQMTYLNGDRKPYVLCPNDLCTNLSNCSNGQAHLRHQGKTINV